MPAPIDANNDQILLLPPNVAEWLTEDHPARFVWDLVDALNLEQLGIFASEAQTGRPAFAAKLLLRLWLYGWMDRTRSTRMLEKRCRSDLAYIWLTGNNHPDHNTIWRFFRDNKKALRKLFKQVVRLSVDAGLVGFVLHAIDGTKMQAVCSTDKTLHKEALLKKLADLDKVIDAAIAEIEATGDDGESFAMPAELADAKNRKRTIELALAQLAQEGRSHMNPHEPDAEMVKGRGGSVMGYNAQAVVDHDSDMIVAQDLSADANDQGKLVPMLDEILQTTGRVAQESCADSGYYSGEQIDEAERRNYPVVVNIPKDSSGKGKLLKECFQYDRERDLYTCPLTGEELLFWRIDKNGMSYPRRTYRCVRKDCPHRGECTNDRRMGRTIKRSPHDDALERHKQKLEFQGARNALELRKEVVEHAFGNIKFGDGLRRFTAWGQEGASAQWALACTVFNLRKMYLAWRCGQLVLAA